jgi:(5-formylfuran-3-yl)methyl phosphate synthase
MTSERQPEPRHVKLLASVTSEFEARLAASIGADIIDCKNPAEGALGALPCETVARIRKAVPSHIMVSATIGDLPMTPAPVRHAVERMAATGADIVKIGLFPGEAPRATIEALSPIASRTKLVAVMLADLKPDYTLAKDLVNAGFMGVMLDTAGKSGTTLLDHMTASDLAAFLRTARAHGLMTGLAGSLKEFQIPGLVALDPDVLGFRGALCKAGNREAGLDRDACLAIRRAIPARAAIPHVTTLELERSS